MIRNDQIQAAWIARLKANTTITAKLVACGSTASEIREDYFQGDDFDFPNVRVRTLPSTFTVPANCDSQTFSVSFLVFSESQSSYEADEIAGIIANEFNDITFTQNTFSFYVRIGRLIPATRSDVRLWRSEVILEGRVSGPVT